MMKGQKGITLVALIITIIVMLILVAVTISVALEGGLFDRARDARDKTKRAQIEEALTLAKAEAMADFYADGTEVDPDQFKAKAETYLDGITLPTISVSGDSYTFSMPEYQPSTFTISMGPGMTTAE